MGPIALATSLDPCAKAIADAVTIIKIANADSTPYSFIFSLLIFNKIEVIIATTIPRPKVTITTSLSVNGSPTCFKPFLAVTNPIITATKKLYIGIKDTAACAGSLLSNINFLALRNKKKAMVPDTAGDTTQLAAIVPTFPHETASKPMDMITKPTIEPTIE